MTLQVSVPAVDPSLLRVLAELLAVGVGAALVSAVSALVYRWYTGLRLPPWLSILLGLSVVALALNTVGVFTDLLSGETGIFSTSRIVFNTLALAVGGVAAPAGRLVGDRAVLVRVLLEVPQRALGPVTHSWPCFEMPHKNTDGRRDVATGRKYMPSSNIPKFDG